MFKINYRIVESYDRLREMTAETYDRQWGNIEGLIELQFEGDSMGYIFNGEITSEMYKAGCFQDELLVSWFVKLLDTVISLHQSDYVALHGFECPKFIEFFKQGDQLLVHENVEEMKKCKTIDDMPLIDKLIFSFKKFKDTGKFKLVKSNKEEIAEIMKAFQDTTILQSEFEQEVVRKAQQFVEEVASQYPWLMPSRTFTSLKDKIENVRILIK